MMEALRSDTLHASDPMHSLSCINNHHIDDLSKEKEEELLYGAGDDVDEEDALSDDSMRLRLSDDDEGEAEDAPLPVLDNTKTKAKISEIGMTSEKIKDVEDSPNSETPVGKNEIDRKNTSEEEHCADDSMFVDEKKIQDVKKKAIVDRNKVQKSGNEHRKPQMTNMLRPWQYYDSHWRFVRSGNTRFRNANNPYNRYRHLTPRGHYRFQSCDYVRFHNAFLPFERGRGNIMFNSYNRSMYGHRQQKRGFRSNTIPNLNNSTELDQNLVSPSNMNLSPKAKVNNDVKNITINNSNVMDKDSTLSSSKSSVSSSGKNDQLNESLNKNIENTNTMDFCEGNSVINANSINNSLEVENNVEKDSEIIRCNHDECKDGMVTETSTVNDNNVHNEMCTNSAVDSHDNSKLQVDEATKDGTNNADSDSGNFCISDNSKQMEALDMNNVECAVDDTKIECVDKNSISNKEECETSKTTDTQMKNSEKGKNICKLEKQDPNRNEESKDMNLKKKSEENSKPVISKSLIEEKAADDELKKTKVEIVDPNEEKNSIKEENKVCSESIKLSEDGGSSVSEVATTAPNNLASNKDGDENKGIKKNDLTENPITISEICDNDELKTSDNSTNSSKISMLSVSENQLTQPKVALQEQSKDVEKEVELANIELSLASTANKTNEVSKVSANKNSSSLSTTVTLQNNLLNSVSDVKNNTDENVKKTVEPGTTQKRRRRTKKMIAAAQEAAASEEDKQVRESGRQKRRTAKNAEEIIRKKFLSHDSDLESSDGSEKFVTVNYKVNQDACPLSPPSLKRSSDINSSVMNGNTKKIKISSEALMDEGKAVDNNSETVKKLNFIRKFFQRDLNEKLPKLKQEELEELLIQKIVETITMRDEIGRLREQARISEKNQEVTRAKCQQLAKQIKDFEMVLSRNAADRRANNDKPTPPIKINRSVGLQVNFVTDHGIQNLRQLQQNSNMKSLHVTNNSNSSNSSSNAISNTSMSDTNNGISPRKGIKVRSPRRTEPLNGVQTSVVPQNPTQSPNIISSITPAALVVTKPVDTQHSLTLPNQSNVPQIISNQQPQPQQSQQAIVLNGKFPNQINRQGPATPNVAKPRTNDLIDLTDEEEKSKANTVPVITTAITDQQINLAQKTQQPCFQRVIQTIPGNVALTSQPPSIRVVQPATQPTPTALVNNMNAPRLAYVMQSGVGPARQLLIAPNSSPMRPVTSCRPSFSAVTYKTGISTIANGTVRVLTTPATSNIQLKHPAPLPDIRNYAVTPHWKLPPPAPSLRISKVAHGIVLSWNMILSDKHADIASYQLYAYQEIAGVPPSTSLWKKVGDVRALPLPMACTLTQFSEGNNYYFAVRAVDTHSRKGQYSIPGNISL